MATLYGVNATNRDVTKPSVKIRANQEHGRLRVKHDSITFAAELAAADVINMMKLPKGAKLYGVRMDNEAIDANDIDVGWAASVEESSGSPVEAADPNGILDAADWTFAGIVKMEDSQGNAGQDKEFDAEVQIQILVNDASTTATGQTVKLSVYYAVD